MKKVSVLILVAILGIVLWALPAGAEKIRLSDAQLDEIAAGNGLFPCGQVCVPLEQGGGVAFGGIAFGGPMGTPQNFFAAGGGSPLPEGGAPPDTALANIMAQGMPGGGGKFSISFEVPGMMGTIIFQH